MTDIRPKLDQETAEATLAAIHHGILTADREGIIRVCNQRAIELLRLPPGFAECRSTLADVVRMTGGVEITRSDDGATAVFSLAPGSFIEIGFHRLAAGGVVIVVDDVSADRARDEAFRQAESEYRSLFENSVCGIYRDMLDGTPLRANRAIAMLNGYGSEAEHLAAVRGDPRPWYVEEGRAAEFHRILRDDGMVEDFVSEVYRHRTGERFWITENAWTVRDAHGRPLFVEGTIQDATERIESQSAMERLASVDALTGACSRFLFMRELNALTEAQDTNFAVYCVDLDNFKEVNDLFGHAAGDAVLKAVTERLRGLVGGGDIVARLGGDEFAILTGARANISDPELLTAKIVKAFCEPVALEGRHHKIGASIGIAVFPDHGSDTHEFLKSADLALYEAKSSGRNTWHLFGHELRRSMQRRKTVETELRDAARLDQLSLNFQPIVNSNSNRAIGFETLLRWNNPVLGQVSPGDFIPVAEQSGMMIELGAWVISRALEAAAAFPRNVRLGINVSANQFGAPGFLTFMERELTRSGVAAHRIVLELTESVLMSNRSAARGVLVEFRKLGLQIALDDFGTGYSSLSYLQHFPINVVKIDRSFVAGMLTQKANLSVIRAVLGIGRDLGIGVVAEGVELPEQAEALKAEGCLFMQGYLFGKAKPLTDAVADLALSMLPEAASSQQKTA